MEYVQFGSFSNYYISKELRSMCKKLHMYWLVTDSISQFKKIKESVNFDFLITECSSLKNSTKLTYLIAVDDKLLKHSSKSIKESILSDSLKIQIKNINNNYYIKTI